jgi:hypothetical protein
MHEIKYISNKFSLSHTTLQGQQGAFDLGYAILTGYSQQISWNSWWEFTAHP